MRKDKFRKSDVIARLKENRAKHATDYEESMEGYREKALAEIEKAITTLGKLHTEVGTGKEFVLTPVYFSLKEPESHLDDYDQMIDLFEMIVDEEIELDTSEFTRYMRDNWEWAQEFRTVNAAYKAFKA